MVHVQRGDLVAERAQRVPEARRVGAARDEAGDGTAGLDQLVAADVRLDAGAELVWFGRGGVDSPFSLSRQRDGCG
jgi:hypothetical protein